MNTTLQERQNFINRYGDPETYEELFDNVRQCVDDQLNTVELHIVGLAWDITHGTQISCTHSAPAGQQTNWSGDHAYPRHYPGWAGRVWIRVNSLLPSGGHPYVSRMLKNTLTHSGSGGFGTYSGPWQKVATAAAYNTSGTTLPIVTLYSWDYKIFEQDFPLITANIIKNRLLTVIKTNEHPPIGNSKIEWTHPATQLRDAELIAKYDLQNNC